MFLARLEIDRRMPHLADIAVKYSFNFRENPISKLLLKGKIGIDQDHRFGRFLRDPRIPGIDHTVSYTGAIINPIQDR